MLSREHVLDICRGFTGADYHITPDLPANKLQNAVEHFPLPAGAQVIALIDSTVFGSCKEGLAVTEQGLLWHNGFASNDDARCDWRELAAGPVRLYEPSRLQICRGVLTLTGVEMKTDAVLALLHALRDAALAAGAPAPRPWMPEGRAFPAAGETVPGFLASLADVLVRHGGAWMEVGSAIKPRAQANARLAIDIGGDSIQGFIDTTVWSSGKAGLVIGENGVYWRNAMESAGHGSLTWRALAAARIESAGSDHVVFRDGLWFYTASYSAPEVAEFLREVQWLVRAHLQPDARQAALHAAGEDAQASASLSTAASAAVWYVAVNGQQFGPYDAATVGTMAASGQAPVDVAYAWTEGMAAWVPLRDVPELAGVLPRAASAPAAAPARRAAPPAIPRSPRPVLDAPVDVNGAGMDDLLVLPGMTLAAAELVMAERGRRGGFRAVEQVGELLRLPPHEVEAMRPMVTFGRMAAPAGRLIDF